MPSYEIHIKTSDDPRGLQNATEETVKLTDAMGKLLERAKRKEEYAAAKEAIAGMTNEEREAALAAYKMAQAQTDASRSTGQMGGSAQQATGLLSGLKGSWIEMAGAISVVKTAYQALQSIHNATVGEFMDLADRTRDLMEVTGATAEQASALIAIGDDLQISADEIQRAFEGAVRKGFDPSVQGLAQLGEQFRAIQNPVEQTRFLMEVFGRTGADVRRLLELNRYELREMANEAARTGQVLSQAEMDMAQAHREAKDALSDAWTGWTRQMGQVVMPVLTEVFNFLGGFNEYLLEETHRLYGVKEANDKLNGSYKETVGLLGQIGGPTAGGQRGSLYNPAGYHAPGSEGYNPSGYVWTERAAGGPVEAGRLYKINENKPWTGPEYFLAPADGMIIPGVGGGTPAGGAPVEVTLVYSPAVSLGDRYEAENVLVPLIKQALRNVKA